MQYSIVNMQKGLILGLSIFFLFSCEKDFNDSNQSIVVKGSTVAIPSEYFDWDNADYMPTPPGYTKIHVPWYVGATGSITSVYPADVYSDHKASDGWEMLYNKFSSTTYTPRPYFILYNKYRGLLRIYHYNDNPTLTTSSKILAGIKWDGYGNGSNKIFNYLDNTIIDINSSKTSYYAVEPSPANSSELPVSPYKWYMLQYEMAYDPSITPTQSQTPPTLSWYINFNNITQFSLGGTLISNSPGKTGSSNFTDAFIDSKLTGVVKAIGNALFNYFGMGTNPGMNESIWNIIKASRQSVLASLVAGTSPKVSNLLGGILGGSSNGTTVTLNIDATLKLNGTGTSNGSLFAGTSMYMPGSLATKPDGSFYVLTGQLPIYNKNLGVFNLSSKPVVPVLAEEEWIEDSYEVPIPAFGVTFGLIDNSDKIVYNPAVLAVASVQVVQQDVLIFYDGAGQCFSNYNEEIVNANGRRAYINPEYIWAFYSMAYYKAVRFVIKVTPNDPSIPPSYIVKTFLAD